MYCGSQHPIAHVGYDKMKRPRPPYKTFIVTEVRTSDPRLEIENVSVGHRTYYLPEKFTIYSGQDLSVSGKWQGPVSLNPCDNLTAEVEFIGKLV